jgi:hypothetical protein
MTSDPIVDEVRSIRDAIARAHEYNVEEIFAMLRKLEEASNRTHVRLDPRTASILSGDHADMSQRQ